MTSPDLSRSMGWAAADWIEHYLVHGPGDVQGQRIELDDEFTEFIVRGYVVDAKGDRLVRRAFLSRAKGRSKSGLAGFVADFEALGPCRFDHWAEAGEVSPWGYEYDEGEPVGRPLTYAEILCVATEEGQAGNTYDVIYYTLHPETCSPELLADYGRLDVGLTRINLPGKRGFIEPVTSADTSADGAKSTFIVADETHLWVLPRLHRLHGVMTRNLLKRKAASGWMLETSTMYAEGENSVAEGTHAYAESSSRSRKYLLFDHRQAAESWDITKRRERLSALREAYGPASAWMNLDAIADSYDDPQVSEGEFRRYWLNQPVPLVAPSPSVMPNWAVLASAEAPPKLKSVGVALDLDRVWCSVGGAGIADDGTPFLIPQRRERMGPWVAPLVKELWADGSVSVVIDSKGPAGAGSIADELAALGVSVVPFVLEDYVKACADLFDMVEQFEVRHPNDDDLNAAVATVGWRSVSERRVWARKAGDISMLEAVTLALWASADNYDVLDSFH
jgi:hypothetical protein